MKGGEAYSIIPSPPSPAADTTTHAGSFEGLGRGTAALRSYTARQLLPMCPGHARPATAAGKALGQRLAVQEMLALQCKRRFIHGSL